MKFIRRCGINVDDLSTRREYTKDGPATPQGARVFKNGSAGIIMLGSDGKRQRRNRKSANPIEEMMEDVQNRQAADCDEQAADCEEDDEHAESGVEG